MIVESIAEVPAAKGKRALVPTMGALHEGHLSLIRKAKSENDEVAVSVFVNPIQFGPNEDYAKYPRRLGQDAAAALDAGADWIFAPAPEEMYRNNSTTVVVKEVTETYEGSLRPGHFDGVATVVLKLFNIVRPDTAYFGLKDLQQCQVISRMVANLNVPVRLRFCETMRESDGLAMSSRNAYLTPEQRSVAPTIYREITRLKGLLMPNTDVSTVERELRLSKDRLSEVGFDVDYLDLVDLATMRPSHSVPDEGAALVVAARIGSTRLIDNAIL